MSSHRDIEGRVDLALIDAAADLHRIDPLTAGLAGLGRPDGFGRRQVDGWREQWSRAADTTVTDLMERVAERLSATLPEPPTVAILHNDLKLDNCQFQADDPDLVTSVFDWDMATLGDPLFDLGLLLTSMSSNPVWVLSEDEAVDRYASRSGIDVTRINWYVGFAMWRTAVVLQQLHNRYLAGDSAEPVHTDLLRPPHQTQKWVRDRDTRPIKTVGPVRFFGRDYLSGTPQRLRTEGGSRPIRIG